MRCLFSDLTTHTGGFFVAIATRTVYVFTTKPYLLPLAPEHPMPAKIYPVIHHKDAATTLAEAELALNTAGVAGVFLISHSGHPSDDVEIIMQLTGRVQAQFPQHEIGFNALSLGLDEALIAFNDAGLSRAQCGLWFDSLGIHSSAFKPSMAAQVVREYCSESAIFAGVAFKHQAPEPDPVKAADMARALGFIPTTSGPATGIPPSVEKIASMSVHGTQPLAVASGMTPNNVAQYAPYLSHILVSTGISRDAYHLDPVKLRDFVQTVQA
jgi:hypothetical protein